MAPHAADKRRGVRVTVDAPDASYCKVADAQNRTETEQPMKRTAKLFGRLISDERGGEVLEYALIAGLIVIAAIAVIGSVGTKVLARWNSVNTGM